VTLPSGRIDRDRNIGTCTYRVAPLRGEDVLDVLVLVLRTLAPVASEQVLSAALSGRSSELAPQDGAAGLAGSLPEVLRSLDRESVQEVRRLFATVTEVSSDGGRAWLPLSQVFGEHFAGRPVELLQWMLHAFTVSFPFFSLASAPSQPNGLKGQAGASPSPSTSAGSSGGQ
jgi:hypothetical protein